MPLARPRCLSLDLEAFRSTSRPLARSQYPSLDLGVPQLASMYSPLLPIERSPNRGGAKYVKPLAPPSSNKPKKPWPEPHHQQHVQYLLNTRVLLATGSTTFALVFGRAPTLPDADPAQTKRADLMSLTDISERFRLLNEPQGFSKAKKVNANDRGGRKKNPLALSLSLVLSRTPRAICRFRSVRSRLLFFYLSSWPKKQLGPTCPRSGDSGG
ncbi:MAG: hypothetical protein BJ554DRAFT_1254 [Olpidium bornovanus]|uniref:Uncharacterized protein n=1 Tax=Olpidium bornovanus TaxID=278681 RepID=A0A8H8DLZ0_9FUNG|nr:MAG: hypothetical protein BJ554DRAFT_1254 [Olpidium bornovanus]